MMRDVYQLLAKIQEELLYLDVKDFHPLKINGARIELPTDLTGLAIKIADIVQETIEHKTLIDVNLSSEGYATNIALRMSRVQRLVEKGELEQAIQGQLYIAGSRPNYIAEFYMGMNQ